VEFQRIGAFARIMTSSVVIPRPKAYPSLRYAADRGNRLGSQQRLASEQPTQPVLHRRRQGKDQQCCNYDIGQKVPPRRHPLPCREQG
jgi:hypothetical protein